MKRTLLLLIIISSIGYSIAADVNTIIRVDSLYQQLKPLLNKDRVYYVGLQEDKSENSQLISKLILDDYLVIGDMKDSDFIINYSFQSRINKVAKKNFLFSRTITQQEIDINARLIDSQSQLIKNTVNKTIILPVENDEPETSLWKPFVISLITGSLIYSLWVLE